MTRLREAVVAVALISIGLVSGEFASRLDDFVSMGIPIVSNPRFDDLFFTLDDGIRRGIPSAKFKRVQLNNLGLLGPDVPLERRPDCERWLFLGASETFGEASLPGSDYPSAVREGLSETPCIEVANAASPGLNLRMMTEQFDAYLFRLRPDVVFIYPPTHFYLLPISDRRVPSEASLALPPGVRPPTAIRPAVSGPPGLLDTSRLLERIRDSADFPPLIQRQRARRRVEALLVDQPPDWVFRTIPSERLEILEQDLEYLTSRIRSAGATPIVIVHTVRVADPPRAEDSDDLLGMRAYTPQATPEIFAAFEYRAADRTRAVAERLGILTIDLARAMSGQRDLFVDAVHFSPTGRTNAARLILEAMRPRTVSGTNDALQ